MPRKRVEKPSPPPVLSFDEKVSEFLRLYDTAMRVFSSALPWDRKYDLIFDKDVSGAANKLFPIDWLDPDTSYEDDVRAFMEGWQKRAMEFRQLQEAT